MTNTDRNQPPKDKTSSAEELAIDLLFKRIAERGRVIRSKQQTPNEKTPDDIPPQDKQMMKHQCNESNEQLDPIVEILRLAYRRGLAIRKEQNQSETPLVDPKVNQVQMEFGGNSMNEQGTLEKIDWIGAALNNLEKAISDNNRKAIEMETQTIRLELGNLREMLQYSKKSDK